MIRHKYSGTVVGRLGWEKAVTLEVRNQSFSQSTFGLSIPLFHLVRFLSIQRKVTSCWWSLSECISIIFLLSALQLQNLANTKILITPFNAIHIPWLNTPSHYVQLDFAMVALGFQKSPAEAHSIARHGRTRVDKGHSAIDTIIDDGTVMFISCFWFECRVAKCWTINRTQIAERLSYMALIPDLPLCYLRRGQSSWSDLREAIVHGVWFNVAQLTTAWKIFNCILTIFQDSTNFATLRV